MTKHFITISLLLSLIGFSCKKPTPTSTSATVSTLNCSVTNFTSGFSNGVSVNGVTLTIPYTNGNGGTYSAFTVSSTGVTGLTATVNSGKVDIGNGNLILSVSGIPSNSGTAYFNITFGGNTCTTSTIIMPVAVQAVLTTLDCKNATINGDLCWYSTLFTQGVNVTNVPVNINYTGGNEGNYSAFSVYSTGVTGLTATVSAGNVVKGNGSITLLINGTPNSSGQALFNFTLGGLNCGGFGFNVKNVPLNKSLLTDNWWESGYCKYFNSNGSFNWSKGCDTANPNTRTWAWQNGDTLTYNHNYQGITNTNRAVVVKLTTDTLILYDLSSKYSEYHTK